ncbi:hypothetical protein NL676_019712 [Syzygium grande]|nr:hypothetical protein NL676_019712 [Syzygium grande]
MSMRFDCVELMLMVTTYSTESNGMPSVAGRVAFEPPKLVEIFDLIESTLDWSPTRIFAWLSTFGLARACGEHGPCLCTTCRDEFQIPPASRYYYESLQELI